MTLETTGLIKYDQARQALMEANTVDEVKAGSVLFSERSNLPEVSGIYFVYDGPTCIYVGQARNLRKRWKSHHRYEQINSRYPKSRIVWIAARAGELETLEKQLIQEIKPQLNRERIIQEKAGKPIYVPENILTDKQAFLDFFSFGATNQ